MTTSRRGHWLALVAFTLWLSPAAAFADSVTLAWDPADGATGYTVRWGTVLGSYPNSANAGSATQFVISGLTAGGTYYAVVQSYNSSASSAYSTPLQFTVPGVCAFSINPTSVSISSAEASGTIYVTTATACAWSATSSSGFITIQNGTGKSGSGSVGFTVAANTTSSTRTGTATIAGQTFTVTQQGVAPCTYSINPASISISSSSATGTMYVTTGAGCAWSASSSSGFISFQNGTGRTGSGSLDFTVAANTSTSSRTGTATVAGQTFTVTQAGAVGSTTTPPDECTYSISPASISISSAAATGTISVTTQTGCAWSASSTSGFITFENGTGRTSSGSLTFTVAANTSTSSRTGTATVAGKVFTVSQAGSTQTSCTYSLSPSSVLISSASATGTILVTTQTGCVWSATDTTFIKFKNGTGRTGPGTVDFTVTANTSTSIRTLTATVAGQTFTVTQYGAASTTCTYSISPTSVSISSAAASGTIYVTTQTGCAWSATSASNFVTFENGTGRSGPGSVTFTVAANTTTSVRTGTATVAGKTFTVTQAGQAAATCTYSISPTSVSISSAAASGTINVTTQSGCAWSATSASNFVTFDNGTGRSGPGSLTFNVAENTSTSSRTGTATVAGATFTVTQAGVPAEVPSGSAANWTSDFDGDGKNDLLVHDSIGGGVEAWFLDGATVKGTQPLSSSLSNASWRVAGRGDFNADGKADLVLQHKTEGWVYIWFMDGVNKIGGTYTSINKVNDTRWEIVGVGDLNKDGRPDLVWQHSTEGALAVWQMNGATVTSSLSLIPDRTLDLLWKVVGVADFNADGSSDLLWRHMGRGEVGVWLMNGVSRIIYSPLNPFSVPDQHWQVAAVTDANGDGKPDIVWEHTDGWIALWYMNGTSRVSNPSVSATLPNGSHIVGPK